MNTPRPYITIFIILLSTTSVWAQNAVENLPTLDPSSTFIEPTFFNKLSTYLILVSMVAIVFASGIWYSVYLKAHQHPYLFLEEAEKSATLAEEDGKIEEAKDILNSALHTIRNNPKRFTHNGKDVNETIWFLKRKLQELNKS